MKTTALASTSSLEESPCSFLPILFCSRVSAWISFTYSLVSPLNICVFFLLCPKNLLVSPSVISLLHSGHCIGGRVLSLLGLHLSYLLYVVSLLCRNCSISSQLFFRRNFSLCKCRFGVSMGGTEFKVFLHCHVGTYFHGKILNTKLYQAG